MRIYLPIQPADLDAAQISPRRCWIVTEQWLAELGLPSGDVELAEEEALYAAAFAAWRAGAPGRVAAVANVPDKHLTVNGDDGPGLTKGVSWHDVKSLHTDTLDEMSLLRAAATGGEALAELQAEPLSWFDVTERDVLKRILAELAEQL